MSWRETSWGTSPDGDSEALQGLSQHKGALQKHIYIYMEWFACGHPFKSARPPPKRPPPPASLEKGSLENSHGSCHAAGHPRAVEALPGITPEQSKPIGTKTVYPGPCKESKSRLHPFLVGTIPCQPASTWVLSVAHLARNPPQIECFVSCWLHRSPRLICITYIYILYIYTCVDIRT